MDFIFGLLSSGANVVIPFVVLLGLLVFVHELGHFLVAVWCGVRVEVFSLGFGPKILSFRRGPTEYCVSAFPLGGYVKMFGDDPTSSDELSEEERKVAFTHKALWQRVAVVLAGPLMNFFFAALVFLVIGVYGEDKIIPQVGDVPTTSAAYEAGLRSGDTVTAVNGTSVTTYEEFQSVLNKYIGKKATLDIERTNESPITLEIEPIAAPNPNMLSFDKEIASLEGLSPLSKAAIVGVSDPKSLAGQAGFQTKDVVTSINGTPIKFFRQIESSLFSLMGKTANVTVKRNDKEETLTLAIPTFSALSELGLFSGDLFVREAPESGPAGQAGIKAGDRITHINNQILIDWNHLTDVMKGYKKGDPPLKINLIREGETLAYDMTPKLITEMSHTTGQEVDRFIIGIGTTLFSEFPSTTKIRYSGMNDYLIKPFEKTYEFTIMMIYSIYKIITNDISVKNIGGVISIGQAASQTFNIGLVAFLHMMALVSINLFILNLLPVPVLDGGHLLFYFIEFVQGKPLSVKRMFLAQQIGVFLLLSLMVFSIFNDVTRLLNISW